MDVDERKASWGHSSLDPDTSSVKKSNGPLPLYLLLRSGQNGNPTVRRRFYLCRRVSSSARTWQTPPPFLIILRKTRRPNEGIEPSAASDEKKSSWKPTTLVTAKLPRAVRNSTDTFGPLKSVAGGICSILENYEARSSPRMYRNVCTHPGRNKTVSETTRFQPTIPILTRQHDNQVNRYNAVRSELPRCVLWMPAFANSAVCHPRGARSQAVTLKTQHDRVPLRQPTTDTSVAPFRIPA